MNIEAEFQGWMAGARRHGAVFTTDNEVTARAAWFGGVGSLSFFIMKNPDAAGELLVSAFEQMNAYAESIESPFSQKPE